VGVESVRELCRVMAARHAAGGFVVTSGSFTAEARQLAEGREVELIGGDQLRTAIATQVRRTAPLTSPR
jgi:restriction system protein